MNHRIMAVFTAIAFPLIISNVFAADLSFSTLSNQKVGLGATITQELTLNAGAGVSGDIKVDVDTSGLALSDPFKEVSVSLSPSVSTLQENGSVKLLLTITTKTSAPSFAAGSFTLHASVGGVETSEQVSLEVMPLYVVNVLNGTNGDPFTFDSTAGTVYFRPHAKGLVVEFHNLSSQAVVIHGEGAIPHQDTESPMTPAVNGALSDSGRYVIPAILPGAGSDLPGYYTIHGVYKPDRNVVVNATKFP
jgi:hypothetical protein